MIADLKFVTKKGQEIESVFDDLAALRITVFRDYPYLYEGTVEYEKEYLQIYSRSERALLFAVYNAGRMVGATTCIPLSDETADVKEPFLATGLDVDKIFYFGESILLHAYRGLGLGHRFFDTREAHARSFGIYKTACFCSVDRGDSHPAKPVDYRPNDVFWIKRGYLQDPSLQANMSWQDVGETESSEKQMIFWVKDLS